LILSKIVTFEIKYLSFKRQNDFGEIVSEENSSGQRYKNPLFSDIK
jgi:hypothetical protein